MPAPRHRCPITPGPHSFLSGAGLSLSLMMSGCSMAMALHGHPEPNFDNIQIGATSEAVERELGKPVSTKPLDRGKHEQTFQYEMGNTPNPGRAAMWGYAWLTIIGILGEPIYSLIELMQGHDETTVVVFDSDNRAIEITGYRPPPPSQVLLAAQDAQARHTRPASEDGTAKGDRTDEAAVAVDGKMKELAHRLSIHLQDQHVKRVAVLPVRDTLSNENQALGNYLTEKLTAKLHEENSAKIVERSQLTRVTQELSLTHSGAFGEESAMNIGHLLGVEAVVTTLYADLGSSSLDVTSRIVRVETGEILGVGTVILPRGALERLMSR